MQEHKLSISNLKRQEVPLPDATTIADSIGAGLCLIDRKMRVLWMNQIQQIWFGPLSSIKGKHCYEVFQRRHSVCPGCPATKIFRYGYSHSSCVKKEYLPNLHCHRYFRLLSSPIRDKNGKVIQVLELNEDITDHIRSDRDVRKQLSAIKKELEFISRLDRDFISLEELSLDKILKQAVGIATSLVGTKMCSLRLLDSSHKSLISRVSVGIKRNFVEGISIRIGCGIPGKVARTKRPVVINNLERYKSGTFTKYLKIWGVRSAICVPILVRDEVTGTLALYDKRKDAFTKEDCRLLMCFANHIAILIDDIKAHREVFEAYLDTIKSLVSAVEARDPYTRGHSEKVTRLAIDIANIFGLSYDDKLMLTHCGRLHDIGKIAISDTILKKPGPLTIAERLEIQLHPLKGAEILSNLKFLQKGMSIIKHHHERFDGRGYPYGLKGKEIPFLARIISCADAFDAITSDRAYRAKRSVKEAVEELRSNRGKQFDPEILDAFIEVIKTKYLTS